jgi:hypothetical protein
MYVYYIVTMSDTTAFVVPKRFAVPTISCGGLFVRMRSYLSPGIRLFIGVSDCLFK